MSYSRVQNRIWNSPTFEQLSDDEKMLWIYILTCPHGNILGMFVLKPGYAIEDLGWSQQRFTKAFSKLLTVPSSNGSEGLILYDENCKLLLIKNYLEHNPITNPNQVKSAIKKLCDLPYSPLFEALKVFVEGFNKDLYKDLVEVLGKPVTVSVSVAVTEAETTLTGPGDEVKCPHEEILKLWQDEMVSEGLPKVREWTKERRAHLKARWMAKKERQDVEWWAKLFQYIKKRKPDGKYLNPFLMGQVEPQPGRKRFLLTFPWLVSSEEKLAKVREGNYED